MNEELDYLTPAQVARVLRVNPVTVRQYAAQGKLRADAKTPGRHRRFLKSDVEEFARNHAVSIALPEPVERPSLRALVVEILAADCLPQDLARRARELMGKNVDVRVGESDV